MKMNKKSDVSKQLGELRLRLYHIQGLVSVVEQQLMTHVWELGNPLGDVSQALGLACPALDEVILGLDEMESALEGKKRPAMRQDA